MNKLNLNIYNIIIFSGIIHGFIFGLILIFNKKLKNKTNTYLALTVFSLALSNLQYWLKDVDLYPKNIDLIFIPFEFLMLPFFFFYVKSFVGLKLSRRELIIFISPFFLFIIHQFIFNRSILSIRVIEILNLVIEYFSIFYSLTIIILVYRLIFNYENSHKSSGDIMLRTKWLKQILSIGVLLCIVWFISISLLENIGVGYYRFYPLWIGISVLIYWIGYVSILQTNLYEQRKAIRNLNRKFYETKEPIQITQNIPHTSNHETIDNITSFIKDKKEYLNPKISLAVISQELNLNETYVSTLINKNLNMGFVDYVNNLRIMEAMRMLKDSSYNNYTIESIGLECGFNTKSNFYSAFKKITGKTPALYKKEVQNL